MKKIKKILFVSIITLVVIVGSSSIFLNLAGKPFIIRKLEVITGRKTTIEYFGLTLTLHLEIKKLNIEGLAKIDSVFITPSPLGLFKGKLIFNNLKFIKPELTFNKTPEPVIAGNKADTGVIVSSIPNSKPREPDTLPLGFRRIKIKNGIINFIDQSVSANGIKVVLKDLNCSILNLYFYPRPVVTYFDLKSNIPWGDGNKVQGRLEFNGWINYFKKDMRATLKIKDIDAVYLYPYYSKWVDLDKARIEKAKLNFSSEINGLNNNITADCHLELTDMVRRPIDSGETEKKASLITNRVLDIFKAMDQGKIELTFSIKTKMDSPQFGFNNFKAAFEDKLMKGRSASGFKPEQALAFPVKTVQNGVNSIADLGRALIDGIIAIGNEIGKAVGEAFKKEPAAD